MVAETVIEFKAGVNPDDLHARAWAALNTADAIHQEMTGRAGVCTSTGEGDHMRTSRHHNGGIPGLSMAFDFRRHYLDRHATASVGDFTRELRKRLGEHYYVKAERTHIHISWKPISSARL